MSLLNDALKAAEQRQQTPAPSPYIGQASAAPRRHPVGKVVLGLGLVVLLAAGAYLYVDAQTAPVAETARSAAPTAEQADTAPTEASTVQHPSDGTVAMAAQDEPQTIEAPAPRVGNSTADVSPAMPIESPETVAEEAVDEQMPEPEAPEPAMPDPGMAAQTPAPEPAVEAPASNAGPLAADSPERSVAGTARIDSQPNQSQSQDPGSEASAAMASADDAEREVTPATSATIKQTRQTPAQQDRDASKAIRSLVARGDLAGAEARLSGLTEQQAAPLSRYAFARGVLARGDVQRALAWVPSELAADDPDLRLIRARAILASGDLSEAVSTLQSRVPTVADNLEYRVTLATLLQQQGLSDKAASHWAELIAWDNSRAPWWVGLAIALEGRGDVPAARRAYQQAAALPGLAPSLADYVRQRLQILGAG